MPDTGDLLQSELVTTWGTILEATARLNGVFGRELEEQVGIPLTWFEVLLRLGRSPGRRLRMTELAAQVSFSGSGLSRLADRIEAAGLVERALCRSDRRGTEAVLTPAGAATLDRALAVHVRGLELYVGGRLSEHELTTVRAAMGTLLH